MKKYLSLVIAIAICLAGCSEQREVPSEDIYDGELEINGHIVPRIPTYEWLTSLGFEESERQACDECHKDTLKFYNDKVGYHIEADMFWGDGTNETILHSIKVILDDPSKEQASFSGGVKVGKTTVEELQGKIQESFTIMEENGIKEYVFNDGPGIYPIKFYVKDNIVIGITVYAFHNPYENKERADISGYESMGEEESMMVDTNVSEISSHMSNKETFVFMAGFSNCPWCNRIMPYINEVASKRNFPIGYINTRKDPSWESNLDIDDYQLFVEMFGEYLEEDEDGIPHLYVPDIYFVKKGKVVMRFDGSIEGADDPKVPLTEEQVKWLTDKLNEGFDLLD